MRRTQERDDSINSEPSWLGDAEQQLTLDPVRASEAFTFPAAFPHCRLSCCRLCCVRSQTKCQEINTTGKNIGKQCKNRIFSLDHTNKYCYKHFVKRCGGDIGGSTPSDDHQMLPQLKDWDKQGMNKYLSGKVAIQRTLRNVFELPANEHDPYFSEQEEEFDIRFAKTGRKLVITITRP